MIPPILLLPSELKCLIVELCSGSPRSLAALARTHPAYQSEAEKVLYDTIFIFAFRNDSLKCMKTLAKSSEKAAFVRSLTVEYASDNKNRNRRVTNYLLKSLVNMDSLSDFRVKSRLNKAEIQMMKGIGKILCQGHFRLKTLYCPDVFNISQIIKSQTDLQILGLYASESLSTITKTLQELRNSQVFLPIVFTLEYEIYMDIVTHIGIFPSLYSVDRRATIHQVLAQLFRKDQLEGNYTKADFITQFSIHLIDPSDMPSIYALAKDIAVIFPRIDRLFLWFQVGHRCEITQHWQEIIKGDFSFFPNLRGVGMYVLVAA